MSFWNWLWDANLPRRGVCGAWPEWLRWTYGLSDSVIAISYFGIAFCLLLIWHWHRQRIPLTDRTRFDLALGMFAAFIASCGVTHLLGALDFLKAYYHLGASVEILTALLSLGAFVFSLEIFLPWSRSVATRAEVQAALRQAEAAKSREKVLAEEVARLREGLEGMADSQRDVLNARITRLFELARSGDG